MRYEGDKRERTRTRLLDEAAAVIRADGPDRLAIGAVMKRAGLTHGGFYFHFKSRDDLLSAAVAHMFDKRSEQYIATRASSDPHEGLRGMIAYYLSMEHRKGPQDGCPIPILAGQIHYLPDTAKKRLRLGISRLTDAAADLLERAGMDDVRNRAISAVTEMVGAMVISRTYVDAATAKRVLEIATVSVSTKFGLDVAKASA